MCKFIVFLPTEMKHTINYREKHVKHNSKMNCKPLLQNDIRELKFNTTGQCLAPLVPTENLHAFYDGVEGCGVQCENPMLTEDEHRQIHLLVAWAGGVCLFFNIITVVRIL